MKPNQLTTDNKHSLNSLFRYYPADLIEAALCPLLPTEIGEHTGIQQLFYAELNEIIQDSLVAYQQTAYNKDLDIPASQALADAQAVINILSPLIPMGHVFFQQGELNSGGLIIVLDQYDYKPMDEIQTAVHFSLMAYPKITFEVIAHDTMVDLMSKGHFYYAMTCIQKNCIYKAGAIYGIPLPNLILLAENKTNAIALFKQNRDKSVNFFDGAKRYLTQNENAMAVFMLQQACEFSYRSLIMVFKGRNIKSHELVALRKEAMYHAPQVIGLFHPKPKKELRLLTLLQEAYVKARYEQAYDIDYNQAVSLMEATSNLMRGVQALFEDFLRLNDVH